ncbi:hypothetical protein NQ317_014290, partial [Molorchus minor]
MQETVNRVTELKTRTLQNPDQRAWIFEKNCSLHTHQTTLMPPNTKVSNLEKLLEDDSAAVVPV